jgi:hypothetical protein
MINFLYWLPVGRDTSSKLEEDWATKLETLRSRHGLSVRQHLLDSNIAVTARTN